MKLSAYDHEVGIGVQSFLRVTPSRKRPTSNFHIFREGLTGSTPQLQADVHSQVSADRPVLRAFTRHSIDLTVYILMTLVRLALHREILVFGVANLRLR